MLPIKDLVSKDLAELEKRWPNQTGDVSLYFPHVLYVFGFMFFFIFNRDEEHILWIYGLLLMSATAAYLNARISARVVAPLAGEIRRLERRIDELNRRLNADK